MESEWKKEPLYKYIEINPRETIAKGCVAKRIGMDKLQPYCRDIADYELSVFSGGSKFRNGDTIMARITPCLENGKVAMVNILDENEIGFGSTEYIVFRAKENLTTPDFVYYLVCSSFIREPAIKSMVGSSGRQRVQTDVVENLEINFPPLVQQVRIASILKTLDDKIDMNNQINNNLEQQAQAIFLEMFPNIFSSSASSTFQNLIEFSNGKKRPEATGNIPVYGGNGILAYTNQANAENCVIIGRVGAYCGNTFLCSEKCWTSDNAIQAKSKKEDSPLFIYYLLKNASLPSRHIGTGQPLMTQGILNSIPVNEPSVQAISSFISICKPMHELIFTNERQNMSLVLLRNSLLPKLMSGELDVSDIDL